MNDKIKKIATTKELHKKWSEAKTQPNYDRKMKDEFGKRLHQLSS